MELETEYGIPSVAVHADAFARLVDSVVRVNGMPRARRAYVPTPVMGKSVAALRAYVEGDDPVHRRPFAAEVLEALTRPVDGEDLRGADFDRSSPRLLQPDSEDALQRLFRENGWTDYLPIVLPTEERVEAMLAGTSRSPDEIVGQLRPTNYRELWQPTTASPSPRTRRRAPETRTTSSRDLRPTRARPRSSSPGATSGRRACARPGRRS
jgi:hypothetical protein